MLHGHLLQRKEWCFCWLDLFWWGGYLGWLYSGCWSGLLAWFDRSISVWIFSIRWTPYGKWISLFFGNRDRHNYCTDFFVFDLPSHRLYPEITLRWRYFFWWLWQNDWPFSVGVWSMKSFLYFWMYYSSIVAGLTAAWCSICWAAVSCGLVGGNAGYVRLETSNENVWGCDLWRRRRCACSSRWTIVGNGGFIVFYAAPRASSGSSAISSYSNKLYY